MAITRKSSPIEIGLSIVHGKPGTRDPVACIVDDSANSYHFSQVKSCDRVALLTPASSQLRN